MQAISNIDDSEEVIEKLGGANDPSSVEQYQLDEYGKLIYNPISSEAQKTGNLHKYNNAKKGHRLDHGRRYYGRLFHAD